MRDYKKWALKEVDKYVEAHALDSDSGKLLDLQMALDLFSLYLDNENYASSRRELSHSSVNLWMACH